MEPLQLHVDGDLSSPALPERSGVGLGSSLQIEIGSRSPVDDDPNLQTASPIGPLSPDVDPNNKAATGDNRVNNNSNYESKKLLDSISIAEQSNESTGLNSFIDGNFGNIYNIKRTNEILGRGFLHRI
jgi:hypothetical protein